MLKDIASLKSAALPTILVGDFNEPSYLDWTEAAAKSGRHPIKVAWPSTKAFAAIGFLDSYRRIYPDEMAHPGFTWTPTTKPDDAKDHHDRLDYVVTPYPSDHRAVTAVFELD